MSFAAAKSPGLAVTERALAESRTAMTTALWRRARGNILEDSPDSHESEEFDANVQKAQAEAKDRKVVQAMKVVLDQGDDLAKFVEQYLEETPIQGQAQMWKSLFESAKKKLQDTPHPVGSQHHPDNVEETCMINVGVTTAETAFAVDPFGHGVGGVDVGKPASGQASDGIMEQAMQSKQAQRAAAAAHAPHTAPESELHLTPYSPALAMKASIRTPTYTQMPQIHVFTHAHTHETK